MLFVLMLISALSEIISLGALIPFLAVLTTPEKVFAYPQVASIANDFGIASAKDLVFPLTMVFALAALAAGALRMFLMWANMRLGLAIGSDLSIDLYRRTLYQPYHVHLARNSSEVITGITHKINGAAFGVLQPALILLSSALLLIGVMSMLIAVDPVAALVSALGFGISYVIIAFVARQRLKSNSEQVANGEIQMVKALQEGLGGIRDVLLDGAQPLYCEIYKQADYPLRRAQGNSQFINASPRYAMEAIGMVLIAMLAFGLSHQYGGIASALPVLGVLALGAQRLLPALQAIYGGWVSIMSCQASLAATLTLLEQPLPPEASESAPPPLNFRQSIQLQNIRFRYSDSTQWVLDALNLTIPKGARVGFVGATGSGKSTVLDILMGLLLPTEGALLVDSQPVSGRHQRAWQRTIAHVPQSIYLADTTLAENIAFGVRKKDIDMERLRQAAKQAQIAEFIENRPHGYDAFVGERGIRLSGGQRQRIGIARALYKQASVLVFDEATSALDNATEQSVMEAIDGLNRDLTILIVAHRLTTVRSCDVIVELSSGRVIAQGSYDELIQHSASFQKLAGSLPTT